MASVAKGHGGSCREPRLEQAGLQFTFTYYGDGFANPWGGVSQGVGYAGRLGTLVDADLERLVDLSGASLYASDSVPASTAKKKGVYKGRKPSVSIEAVRKMCGDGKGSREIAAALDISRMSVWRALNPQPR